MGKLEDYIQASRDTAKAKSVPVLNAKYDGVKQQFEEIGMALVDAEASGDLEAVTKYKKVLEENRNLRLKVTADLVAAGETVTDDLIK